MTGSDDVGEVGSALTITVFGLMLTGFEVMRWRVARTLPEGGAAIRHLFFALAFALVAIGSLLSLPSREVGSAVGGLGVLGVIAGFVVSFLRERPRATSSPPPLPDEDRDRTRDPGWQPSLDAMKGAFLLFVLLRRRSIPTDGLVVLRIIFLSWIASLLLFAAAFSFIAPWGGPIRPVHGVVVAIGLLSLLAASWNARRPLATESSEKLAGSYRTRMFVGAGIGHIPALVALAATFVARGLWIYLVGLSFAFLNFWLIAPGPRNLAREQERIAAAGSPLLLVEALRTPPRPQGRSPADS